MDKDDIQFFLLNIVRQIAMIPTEELEAYLNGVRENNSIFDAIGPILHPTQYRDALQSGQVDDLALQREMTEKLLEIRKLVDAHNKKAIELRKRGQ